MKRIFLILTVFAVAATSCDRDEYDEKSPVSAALYLDAAQDRSDIQVFFKREVSAQEKTLSATLSAPTDRDVTATLAIDADAVSRYNERHGTDYALLDAAHYELSAQHLSIEAGSVISEPVTVRFKDLTVLPADVTYLLPVSVSSPDIGLLEASATVWYLVKQTSAITTVADLTDNWITFPTLDEAGPQSDLFNGLKAVTYEIIVRVKSFNPEVSISSVMGVEQYLLLRFGDSGFPRQQLQVQAGANKFPDADDVLSLEAGEWYHLALTYDALSGQMQILVNGQVQSAGTVKWSGGEINLAMRAMYDADPVGNASLSQAYQFFIGRSYDDDRPLQGEVAEARVWSVVRTQAEIWEHMYDVDPASEGLLGYWKFDKPEDGDVVRDVTGHGNDGVAAKPLQWNTSVEVPQLNKE
ncbi:MAG TPA: DUF1735 and LamG domain-containing protein [Candidatus Alistipes intestinigallinarum]|uniref:DUF1735 and LamG domain-containing protein n=1 Tax=Candidatus Alistipes intestinigallinarum TaxID=2838440 RepID=A0A9D1Z258_9BACT|nr:DUF1735 and LamG domain-containing protein [Candidatus Alistipes intestinigallinarum]